MERGICFHSELNEQQINTEQNKTTTKRLASIATNLPDALLVLLTPTGKAV